MFAQAHYPSQPLAPGELDLFLSKGWFRMAQKIFTCTYISLDDEVYRVFWLRIALDGFTGDKTFKKLLKRNGKFRVTIQEASVTPEKEALYQAYKTGIDFVPSASLEQFLYKGSETNIYNTLEINLHDGDKLIAAGYFDVGGNSAAGISCFYDPAYKKYSPGKYLMYRKMLYCKDQQIRYFYLGYFAPGCKAFDYKLDISKDSLEYFDLASQEWYGVDSRDPASGSLDETRQKLRALQRQLNKVNIENHLFGYKYFQANLIQEFQGYKLFDYPMFIYCFQVRPDVVNPLVVYDFRDASYHLLKCISVGTPEEPEDKPGEFSDHLLMIREVVYSTRKAEELAGMIAGVFKDSKEGFLNI